MIGEPVMMGPDTVRLIAKLLGVTLDHRRSAVPVALEKPWPDMLTLDEGEGGPTMSRTMQKSFGARVSNSIIRIGFSINMP